MNKVFSTPFRVASREMIAKLIRAAYLQDLDRKVLRLVRNDAQVRRFMAAPGVGPITFTRQAGRKTGGNPDPGAQSSAASCFRERCVVRW